MPSNHDMEGSFELGAKDPVTKTLQNLRKIVAKKDDVKWLSKRMLAKRVDPVGKALAGSLHAAHDEDISLVEISNLKFWVGFVYSTW